MQGIVQVNMALRHAADDKERDADQLDTWAKQSLAGGWSTHQVEPMRKKADQLRREASELRRVGDVWTEGVAMTTDQPTN